MICLITFHLVVKNWTLLVVRGGVKIKLPLKFKGVKLDIIWRLNWTLSVDGGGVRIDLMLKCKGLKLDIIWRSN